MSRFSVKNIAGGILLHWALFALQILTSLITTPIIIKTLDNLYFGLWVTLMQFTGYLYLLDFGLRNTVVHRTAQAISGRRRSSLYQLVSASVRLSSILATLTILVSAILAFVIPLFFDLTPQVQREAAIVIFIGGCTVALAIYNNPYEGVVRGFGLFITLSKFGFISLIIRTALTIGLLLLGYKIIALALVQLFVGVMNAAFVMYLAKKSMAREGFRKGASKLTLIRFIALSKSVWRYSWSILFDNISQKLIFSSSTFIIGIVLGVPMVTFYAIASQLIDYLRGLIEVFISIIMPVASKITGAKEEKDLDFVLFQGSRFVTWFVLPIITVYIVLGERFISLWIGKEYAETANTILLILGSAQALSLIQYSITVVMRSLEKHSIIAKYRFIQAVVNIALGVVLAYQYGLVGVAIASAVSQIVIAAIVMPRSLRREMEYSYLSLLALAYVRVTVVCVGIGLIGYLIDEMATPSSLPEFVMIVAGLALLYFAASYFLILDRNERAQIKKLLA